MNKKWAALLAALCLLLGLTPAVSAAEPESVRVAVIDTGISTAVIAAENLAPGYNYIRPQDSTEDRVGHGTAVAGIIVGSEPAGVTGVCPDAVLVPLVWCSVDENGDTVKGRTDMAAQAIYDAIDAYDCDIINLSSGALSDTASLRKAVEYAESRGVLVVSSAGNANESAPEAVYYPSAYDTVLCVGSVDENGESAAWFSQRNDSVDLLAPGDGLRILTVKGTRIRGSGTSYSTAFVSGAAARLLTEDPSLTAPELRRLLTSTARDIGPEGYDIDSGWGVLDLDAALARLLENTSVPFADVPEDAWYREAVEYVHRNGLMKGVTDRAFAPDDSLTRGMLVTILHRLEDEPASPASGFADVKSGAWYAEAVHWAAANGIVGGYGDGRFAPNDAITREQLAAILYRYARYKGCDVTGSADLTGFSDVSDISGYAMGAMSWANAMGLVNGTGAATLMPGGLAARGQVAAILMRFCENIK